MKKFTVSPYRIPVLSAFAAFISSTLDSIIVDRLVDNILGSFKTSYWLRLRL